MKAVKPINITHLTEVYGPGYLAIEKQTGKVIAHAAKVTIIKKN